jgi:hypothetical protein
MSLRQTSDVWKYFNKLIASNEALCKLCVENPCKRCNKENPCKLQGFHSTNAKKHLDFCHPDANLSVDGVGKNVEKTQATKRTNDGQQKNPADPKYFFKPHQLSAKEYFYLYL